MSSVNLLSPIQEEVKIKGQLIKGLSMVVSHGYYLRLVSKMALRLTYFYDIRVHREEEDI